MKTMEYSKTIECPNCGEDAELICDPHKYAGIWECEHCETSDVHEHGDYELIKDEVDTIDSKGEHTTYDTTYYICGGENGCGVQVDDV